MRGGAVETSIVEQQLPLQAIHYNTLQLGGSQRQAPLRPPFDNTFTIVTQLLPVVHHCHLWTHITAHKYVAGHSMREAPPCRTGNTERDLTMSERFDDVHEH